MSTEYDYEDFGDTDSPYDDVPCQDFTADIEGATDHALRTLGVR